VFSIEFRRYGRRVRVRVVIPDDLETGCLGSTFQFEDIGRTDEIPPAALRHAGVCQRYGFFDDDDVVIRDTTEQTAARFFGVRELKVFANLRKALRSENEACGLLR
jgi:hypothetical protein